MQIVDPAPRPVAEALALAPALLELVKGGDAAITASLLEGPAVVLGALQRAGRIVDLAACATAGTVVYRRCTTGTAVYIGSRAVLWTLALPHVAALQADATLRTLLNRNVRGFLRGLSRGGAPAQYFGREWIAIHHRPAALLGFEVLADGRIVIEVFAGLDATIALPGELCAEEEREVDRWRGKEPMAIEAGDAMALVLRVIEAVAARGEERRDRREVPGGLVISGPIGDPRSPVPDGLVVAAPIRAPVGWIDAAVDRSGLWIGGDALVASFAVAELAAALLAGAENVPGDAPIEGATWDDLARAGRAALAARSPA
jgi:lipoyl protein ligase-like protein